MIKNEMILSLITNDYATYQPIFEVDNMSLQIDENNDYELDKDLDSTDIIKSEIENNVQTLCTPNDIVNVILKGNLIDYVNINSNYVILSKLSEYFTNNNIINTSMFTEDVLVLVISSLLSYIRSFDIFFISYIATLSKNEIDVISDNIDSTNKVDSEILRSIKRISSENPKYVKLLIFLLTEKSEYIYNYFNVKINKFNWISKNIVDSSVKVFTYLKDQLVLSITQEQMNLIKEYCDLELLNRSNLVTVCLEHNINNIQNKLTEYLLS